MIVIKFFPISYFNFMSTLCKGQWPKKKIDVKLLSHGSLAIVCICSRVVVVATTYFINIVY